MESLYFIAIVPPANVVDEINQLKHDVAARFKSKHALNAPPHITLHMPFKWKSQKRDKLFAVVNELNLQLVPFEIGLQNFDFFEPRVVFVHVMQNESLLLLQRMVVEACRKRLKLDNANYKDRPFHPHITIGFRDLKKAEFYRAQSYFGAKTYKNAFDVSAIHLLEHVNSKWEVVTPS